MGTVRRAWATPPRWNFTATVRWGWRSCVASLWIKGYSGFSTLCPGVLHLSYSRIRQCAVSSTWSASSEGHATHSLTFFLSLSFREAFSDYTSSNFQNFYPSSLPYFSLEHLLPLTCHEFTYWLCFLPVFPALKCKLCRSKDVCLFVNCRAQ